MPHAIPPTILSEELIERRVERMTDHLDRVYLAGAIDQATYDAAIRDLDAWAEAQHAERTRADLDHLYDDMGDGAHIP